MANWGGCAKLEPTMDSRFRICRGNPSGAVAVCVWTILDNNSKTRSQSGSMIMIRSSCDYSTALFITIIIIIIIIITLLYYY